MNIIPQQESHNDIVSLKREKKGGGGVNRCAPGRHLLGSLQAVGRLVACSGHWLQGSDVLWSARP